MHLTVRCRLLGGAGISATLMALASPATAAAPDLGTAQQNLVQAHAAAVQAGTALGAVQQQLAGAQQQLAAVQARVATLDATLAADNARLGGLRHQLDSDKVRLAAYVRSVYKSGGSDGALAYIIAAANLGDVFQRAAEMDRIDRAGQTLLTGIADAEAATRDAITSAAAARADAETARAQAVTAAAVVAVEADQLAATAAAANGTLASAQQQYTDAQAAAAAAAREAAARQAAAQAVAPAAPAGPVVAPSPGAPFTIDTDLTRPSGESAASLDSFLSGSALAGLGGSFMNAEHSQHVSARYLVAHAILESAWGTSAIARDKHNLFGYGADDSDPYNHARSFASFDACIQYVAHAVGANYLSPSGAYYHGPTLRGMNVVYASDPGWASKIARIASTIPV